MLDEKVIPSDFAEIRYSLLGNLNPHFTEVGHEIVLPNVTYQDYLNSIEHQASFIHEYYHFLQAVCTTSGIYHFFGVADKMTAAMYAIQNRNEIFVPLHKYASDNLDQPNLKHFHDCISNYNLQISAAKGDWLLDVPSAFKEFDLLFQEKNIKDKTIKRFHLVRLFENKNRGIPLLTDVICEGQAESVACHFSNINSSLLDSFGKEKNASELKYNTLFHLMKDKLSNYSPFEALFFCTDFALMTFAPDAAFIEACNFLRQNKSIPSTKSEWTHLRFDLQKKSEIFQNSKKIMSIEISNKQKLYLKFVKDLPFFEIFIYRFEQYEKALAIRESDPLFMFPWTKDFKYFGKIFDSFPASHVRFIDGIFTIGKLDERDKNIHLRQVAVKYFLSFLEGKSHKCPLFDNEVTCQVARDLSCITAPWTRGDLGKGTSCMFGQLGIALGIENSPMKNYTP